MKAAKRSVYMLPEDLKRLVAVRDSLKEEFPAHRVSISWVFRYALYRLSMEKGIEAVPKPLWVEGEE